MVIKGLMMLLYLVKTEEPIDQTKKMIFPDVAF